jgi:hypothetical protein
LDPFIVTVAPDFLFSAFTPISACEPPSRNLISGHGINLLQQA